MQLTRISVLKAFLIIFSQFFVLTNLSFAAYLGKDHGPISSEHEQSAEVFINQTLKIDGKYDLAKIDSFLIRLEKEKVSLSEDMYETKLIENLELNLVKYKKAKKKALKEIDEEKNGLLISYNEFLIPKIKKLRDLLSKGASLEAMDEITDDFIRLYVSFYIPNKQRTGIRGDSELGNFIKRFFKPYKFNRNDPTDLEAANLIVENSNYAEINNCLSSQMEIDNYLSREELDLLKKCGMDISKINPGVSALWQPVTQKRIEEIRKGRSDLFPEVEDKIFFDKVKLSGAGSPKMVVEFTRNGKKNKLKLKMGVEVHSDILTSMMGRFLGFSQDQMSYREKVRVYLGKVSYEKFQSQFSRKYGQESIARYIDAHGGEKGDEWIDITDVLYEAKPKEEMRLTGLSINSWDLSNRREYRSLLLWFGYFNIGDLKPNNFKLILNKSKDGTLYPIHRLHDTGYSLGKGFHFHGGLIDFLGGSISRSINSFLPSFLEYDDKKVEVSWNDYKNKRKSFSTTTYNDLKWMARIIAQVKDEDIHQIITFAGIPEEFRELYHHKIVSRRNQAVMAFDLEDEFPIYSIPDLDTFSPSDAIKNGKVVLSYQEGHHNSWAGENDILGMLMELIDFKNPFSDLSTKFNDKIDGHLNGGIAGLGAGLDATSVIDLVSGNDENPISVLSTSPGISIKMSRKVGNNPQKFDSKENGGARFYVKDFMKFEIDLRVPFFKKLISIFPFSISGELKIYSKEVAFVHYAGSLREAYKKPFKLFHMLRGLKTYAAEELKPMELIQIEDQYGIGANVKISAFNLGPVITNEAGIKAGWIKTTPVYLFRDSFDALHVYKEKSKNINFGVNLNIVNVNLLLAQVPVLGMDFTYNRFFYEAADYSFNLPSYNDHKTAQEQLRANKELEALNVLMKRDGDEAISSKIRRNYNIIADGAKATFKMVIGFFFRKKMEAGHSKVAIELKDGSTRSFYRYYINKSRTFGVGDMPGPDKVMEISDIMAPFYFKGKAVQVVTELDGNDPKNFVSMIKTQEYYRTRDKKEIENIIESLNLRFSVDKNQPFYRNYILPDEESINKYRKVYPNIRVFVNSNQLVEKVKNTSSEDLKIMALDFFKTAIIEKHLGKNPFRRTRSRFRTYILVKKFKLLKKAIESNDRKSLIKNVSSFLANTFTDELGIDFLKTFLGTDNIYIMGNISGIYPNFSNIEDGNVPKATRLFAGKSWGTYSVVPPIQKFLLNESLIDLSAFIQSRIPMYDIFGGLPGGVPLFD